MMKDEKKAWPRRELVASFRIHHFRTRHSARQAR